TACKSNQSPSANKSAVMVPKVRTNRWSEPSGSVSTTQATTVFLWISKPQQRGYKTCIPRPPLWGSQRAVRRETPVSPACSPLARGNSHPSGKRTRISFAIGLVAPIRHDLVSLAPPSSMPQPGPFSSASMSGTDIALRNSRLRHSRHLYSHRGQTLFQFPSPEIRAASNLLITCQTGKLVSQEETLQRCRESR